MSTDLTEEDIKQFLDDNPQFVQKWLSEHGMEEIATDFSIRSVVSKTALNFWGILSPNQDPTAYLNKMGIEPTMPVRKMNLFRDILKLVHSDIDSTRVMKRILQSACILLRCDKTSLLLVQGVGNNRFLISKTNNIATRSQLGLVANTGEDTIHIPFGQGIVGFVAVNECLVNIKEAWRDPRCKDIMEETDSQIRSILLVPVFDKKHRVIGVAKALNKLDGDHFDSSDEILFECFSKIFALNLNNDHFFKAAQGEKNRHQMLLKLSRCFSKNRGNFRKTVSEILHHGRKVLNCDNISIYLSDSTDNSFKMSKSANVLQFLKGNTEIEDASIDPMFISLIERNMNSASMVNVVSLSNSPDRTKRKTKITLEGDIRNWTVCVTIHSDSNSILCYMMFLRKSINTFSENDINMMETVAISCGLAIYNNHLYTSCDKIVSNMNSVEYDLLQFHSTCRKEEAYDIQHQEIRTTSYYKLYSYNFVSYLYLEDEQVILSVLMFLEMNALNSLKISKFTLYRWILTVKKNYRPVSYHNWQHAVNVAQAMFCMLTTGRLQIYFKEFEIICLLTACLFHDIDHRGTNNAFQVNTGSPLATLYNTSIMEYHHVNRSIMILKNEDTNIFRNLSAKKYQQALKFIENAILATDLVHYFEKRNLFKQQVNDGNTFESQESVELLISMMMTAADLTAITKPWEFQKMSAMLMVDEFFAQGDMERAAGIPLLPLMDRNKIHEIPQMQVGFIDFVCTMLYHSLSKLHEELDPLYEGMINNRSHWARIANGDEDFDIVNEYKSALKTFYSGDRVSSVISPILHVNVSTQTVLTYKNLEQEQQTIQTILSYPIEESVTVNDLTIPVSPETQMLSTEAKQCQTEDQSRNLSEAFVQTYVPATRTGEASPTTHPLQVFRRPTSTTTRSGDYSGSETAVSSHSKSSIYISPYTERRSSCFDELLYERRRELEMEKRRSFRNAFCLEKPLSIKRSSRVILPPNPVRRESSQTRSSDYIFNRSSSTIRFSIGELSQKDEILFENISWKSSLRSETASKSSIKEPSKSENVSEKSKDADTTSPKKTKLSWTSAYEGSSSSKHRMPVARKSFSISRDRRESEYKVKSSSSLQRKASQNIEFRKRKCVKATSKDTQKGKRLAICVMS